MRHLEEYVTAVEAAALIGIDRNNVLKAIREGRLAGVKKGGRVLILRVDAEEYKLRPRKPRGPNKKPRGSNKEKPDE